MGRIIHPSIYLTLMLPHGKIIPGTCRDSGLQCGNTIAVYLDIILSANIEIVKQNVGDNKNKV